MRSHKSDSRNLRWTGEFYDGMVAVAVPILDNEDLAMCFPARKLAVTG